MKNKLLNVGLIIILSLIGYVSYKIYLIHENEVLQLQIQDEVSVLINDQQNELKINEAELLQINSDYRGWVKIENTNIDYPFTYHQDDPLYYLHYNFYQEEAIAGNPFIINELKNNLDCRNLIIYAHNMKNGSMFHDLAKYQDIDYYQAHSKIQLIIDGQKYNYQIIAALKEQVLQKKIDVYTFQTKDNEAEYEGWIAYLNQVNVLDKKKI